MHFTSHNHTTGGRWVSRKGLKLVRLHFRAKRFTIVIRKIGLTPPPHHIIISCFFFHSSGQRRGPLLFVKIQQWATWPNCIVTRALASSLELALTKDVHPSVNLCFRFWYRMLHNNLEGGSFAFRTGTVHRRLYSMQLLPLRNYKWMHYCTTEGIGKAAMAAIVAIKPEVVKKFRHTKKMSNEKAHNFALYNITGKSLFWERQGSNGSHGRRKIKSDANRFFWDKLITQLCTSQRPLQTHA